jgi:hypothetical protein
MTVALKGLFTPPAPETRDIAYLTVEHNGQTYDWMIYVPQGVNVGDYIVANETNIYNRIEAKEAEWTALDPKTRTVVDPITNEEFVVDIEKNEVVKPDYPDYYALRREEYPSLGDQLDAFWKGSDSPEYELMMEKIAVVKAKYPKLK